MNHQAILKRAWHILFNYKALWVFGFILALTAASSGGGGGGGGSSSNHNNGGVFTMPPKWNMAIDPRLEKMFNNFKPGWDRFASDITGLGNNPALPWIIVGVVVLVLALITVFVIARYVSKTALIRMVNDYEVTGEKVTWRQGFKLGWSRAAWRLFLIDLLAFLALFLGIALAIGCVGLPFLLGGMSRDGISAGAAIAGIGLLFLFIFAAIILAVIISLVFEPVYRVCVLEGLGVIESLSRGWKLLRANLKDIFLMWLILFGIQIAYTIVIIPIALVVLGIGLVFGGGLGVATYFFSTLFMASQSAWVPAAIVGVILFLLLLMAPLTFVEGLKETYLSSSWTLAYREMRLPRAAQPVVEDPLPEGQG